jgi:hypothetical protein
VHDVKALDLAGQVFPTDGQSAAAAIGRVLGKYTIGMSSSGYQLFMAANLQLAFQYIDTRLRFVGSLCAGIT